MSCLPIASTLLTLIQEAGVNVSEEKRALFLDLHRIVSALKAGDIDPALEYVIPHKSIAFVNPLCV